MKRLYVCAEMLLTILIAPTYAASLYETSPDQVGMSSDRLHRIDAAVEDFIERKEISGAVTLITRRGKIVQFKAYGYRDLDAKAPMKKDSLFRMFSMTKPVTCAAVLILVEEGKLLLTEPISKYLPEFKDMKVLIEEKDGNIITEPATSEITVQQLAMHTSGIGYGIPAHISPTLSRQFDTADVFNPRNPLKDAIKTIASLPLRHHPGTTCLVPMTGAVTCWREWFTAFVSPSGLPLR